MNREQALVRPTVLVVDDTPMNITSAMTVLKSGYKVRACTSGAEALRIATALPHPDIILLDVLMPGMDGYETCRQLKANPATATIPVIFLTAKSDVEDETAGFECGAVDYIAKPISPAILRARVKAQLQLKSMADFLRDKADFLEAEVSKRTREISAIQDVTIMAMASLAETRDTETGNHIRRTQHYTQALARKLQFHPDFATELTNHKIDLIFKSAPLHDIGKVGIPDQILLKPGRLTPEEMAVMRTHTTLGYAAIQHAEDALGIEVDFLKTAKEFALSHQEKWDGSGYPQGLMGDSIPVSARLMAVADVYDALISRRVYKEPIPHAEAVAIIAQGKGTHFDPRMVTAFLEIADEFHAIAQRFADTSATLAAKERALQPFTSPA